MSAVGVIVNAVGVIVNAVGVIVNAEGIIVSTVGIIVSAVGVIVNAVGIIVNAIGIIASAVGIIVSTVDIIGVIVSTVGIIVSTVGIIASTVGIIKVTVVNVLYGHTTIPWTDVGNHIVLQQLWERSSESESIVLSDYHLSLITVTPTVKLGGPLTQLQGEQGSWESGLSYECRSLLFKALHNLIERCLLSRDFVRLGKWFVQPYDGSEKQEKSGHLSFSFAFFVHGESTVCASVDVRQHHPVRTLIRAHLQQAQACLHSGTGVQVILAPYGMAGTLTGQSFKALDAQTQRLMDDWKHFYPTRDVADLPSAVEVIVGGVKLRYPSCYVLVTDMDETTSALINTQPGGIKSSLPCMGLTVSVVGQHQQHPECMVHASTPSTVLPERAWQDSTISLTPGPTSPTPTDPPVPPAHWDFQDPTRKQNCSCPK
ncbi:Mediator of RNA polymerase II transcription subunit 13-like, partial [Homalodisca vitripennis]